MKRLWILPVVFLVAMSALAQSDPWAPLRAFEGKWEGDTSGKPGKGTTTRDYRFELNGKFLFQRDKSVYQPTDPAGKPLEHEDFGVFSYDTSFEEDPLETIPQRGIRQRIRPGLGERGRQDSRVRNYAHRKPARLSGQEAISNCLS